MLYPLFEDRGEVSLQCYNLFNQNYMEGNSIDELARKVSVKFAYRF